MVAPYAPLQVQPAGGSAVAFLGTLLAGWLFFSFTAHAAATFFLGDVPWKRALVVGAVPAVVSALLVRYPPALIIAVGLAADLVAFHLVYRVRYRTAALVVVIHYTVSIALVLLLGNLVALFSTAPR